MSIDQNFQQIWDFRRRDDDINSSSDDSKSHCSEGRVLKKHKLFSNLILPENDESTDTPGCHQNNQLERGDAVRSKSGKVSSKCVRSTRKCNGAKSNTKAERNVKKSNAKREQSGTKSKSKMGSKKKDGNKVRKCSTTNAVSLDDFKNFTDSIIQDLKVERENMFAQMREDMRKLVAIKPVKRQTRKKGSCTQKRIGQAQRKKTTELGKETQNCNDGRIERSIISSRTRVSNNCYNVLDELVNHDQAIQRVGSNGKDKGVSVQLNKFIYSSNHSDQLVSSSYLTLPSILSEPQVEQHRMDSSSARYCIQPGQAANGASMNFERENSMRDATSNHAYISGIQAEVPYTKFVQTGSKNICWYDQHRIPTSSMGSGQPLSLPLRMDNNFNIPSQTLLDNSSRENNRLGLRMNGGAIRFYGNSHALSENVASNNFNTHLAYKTVGEHAGFGTRDIRNGNFY